MADPDDETAREKFEKRTESIKEYMDANATASENVESNVRARKEQLEANYGDTFRVRPRVAIVIDAAIGIACFTVLSYITIPLWFAIPVFVLMVLTFFSLGKSIAGIVS